MIKVENIDAYGFEHAIRGMRNSYDSWEKSDSKWKLAKDPFIINTNDPGKQFVIGENDLALMRKLYKAGSEHRKYLRQIVIYMDITAPLYWWKEFDTYRTGVEKNSCSTMHTIAKKEFEINDFSHEHLETLAYNTLDDMCDALNYIRSLYLDEAYAEYRKAFWWQLIQLLPSSYNQKRTVMMSYEAAVSMIKQRTGHKLDEWNEFVSILKELPYIKQIIED